MSAIVARLFIVLALTITCPGYGFIGPRLLSWSWRVGLEKDFRDLSVCDCPSSRFSLFFQLLVFVAVHHYQIKKLRSVPRVDYGLSHIVHSCHTFISGRTLVVTSDDFLPLLS